MIHNEPCVNGILAAVLSASVIPLHGALAKEKSARLQKAIAKPIATTYPKHDVGKEVVSTPAAAAQ